MKKHLFPLFLLLISLFMFQCKSTQTDTDGPIDDGPSVPLTYEQGWKWTNRPALVEGGKEYILTFKEDGSMGLQLDVNSCFGNYQLTDEGGLSFDEGMGCTEMCCDKDGWMDFLKNLESSTAFKIRGRNLTLSGGKTRLEFTAVNQ